MWSNWSGNQSCDAQVQRPVGADAIRALLRDTTGVVRPVGAGHSFTPLVPGAGHLIAPAPAGDNPIRAIVQDRVRVDPNVSLKTLSEAMAAQGRAFRNLGDINVQTLAGATQTATHGTGRSLQCLAAEITGVQVIDGTGERVEIASEDLPGAQVALGLLGIVTEIEIRTVPAYNLRRRSGVRPIEELIGAMHDNWDTHRNYEFFLLPHSGKGVGIAHDPSDAPHGRPPADLDELGVFFLRAAGALCHVHPGLRRSAIRLLALVMSDEDYVGESWQVLCATRRTRFNEMEYHLPPDSARDVLAEITRLIETRHTDVWFPIEVRQTAGDDAWLSPFQNGPRVSVAVHMHARQVYEPYFRDCEAIFRAAGGRPHWGKLHSLARRDFEILYPDLPKFDALRARLDPRDRFLSPALAAWFRP